MAVLSGRGCVSEASFVIRQSYANQVDGRYQVLYIITTFSAVHEGPGIDRSIKIDGAFHYKLLEMETLWIGFGPRESRVKAVAAQLFDLSNRDVEKRQMLSECVKKLGGVVTVLRQENGLREYSVAQGSSGI